jgi:hypothetical protein
MELRGARAGRAPGEVCGGARGESAGDLQGREGLCNALQASEKDLSS